MTAATATVLVVGLTEPADSSLQTAGAPGETRGVGCIFLNAVFLFVFSVIVIYQPRIPQDDSPYALVRLNPVSVGHLLLVKGPLIRVFCDILARIRQLGCRVFAPRVFPVILPRAAPASLVVRASDVLCELRLDSDACLADRSSFLCVQQRGKTWDLQVQDQLSVCLCRKGILLTWGGPSAC